MNSSVESSPRAPASSANWAHWSIRAAQVRIKTDQVDLPGTQFRHEVEISRRALYICMFHGQESLAERNTNRAGPQRGDGFPSQSGIGPKGPARVLRTQCDGLGGQANVSATQIRRQLYKPGRRQTQNADEFDGDLIAHSK